MALIAIILALFIERFLGSLEELRRFDWFTSYRDWVCCRLPDTELWRGPLSVVVVMAGPLLLMALLIAFFSDISYFMLFIFSVIVLLYTLGPRDLEAEVEAFIDASERKDDESARWHATTLIHDQPADNVQMLYRRITENILAEANERVLAIIFWFVILGPLGALFYRLTSILKTGAGGEDEAFEESVNRLHYLLDWLPVRLCALAYALGGSFVEAMHNWRFELIDEYDANRNVLIASGLGALRFDLLEDTQEADREALLDEVKEAMALVRRAVLVYLALLALLILSGWTF